jgi:hypothetical protein
MSRAEGGLLGADPRALSPRDQLSQPLVPLLSGGIPLLCGSQRLSFRAASGDLSAQSRARSRAVSAVAPSASFD